MEFDGPTVCGSVTGTEGFDFGGGTILGDAGTQSAIYIPIINPHDDLYVPEPQVFNTLNDPALPSFLWCGGPTQFDPGNSKYFALVKADNNTTHVLKAYRNWGDTTAPNTKWVWRMIGNSDEANLATIQLDNCGRVVACPGVTGCTPDQISTDGGVSWSNVPSTSGVVTATNNTFYGFNPDNNMTTPNCPGNGEFETIPSAEYTATVDGSGTNQNDWNENDFSQFSGGVQAVQSRTSAANNRHLAICTSGPCDYVLPGGKNTANVTSGPGRGDGNGDFITSTNIENGDINTQGSDIYSPIYNAVLFIRASSAYGGNLSQLRYNNGTTTVGIDIDDDPTFDLNRTWRITVITFGSADAGGNMYISPPATDPNYRWAIIAGRDIVLHGNVNDMDCNATDCEGPPTGTQTNFGGAVLAHESVGFNGTIGVNGYVIAEDRASCDGLQDSTIVNGSLDIHYDCSNPADYWKSQSVKLQDWEEAQRVQ
jgi:hypothetical protein